jgi:hypothetical protein
MIEIKFHICFCFVFLFFNKIASGLSLNKQRKSPASIESPVLWQSVLLEEEIGVSRKIYQPVASH